jgi:AraC-like DNA-binding protein
MNKIPVHKIHEKTKSGILLRHVEDGSMLQNGEDMSSVIACAHRDNCYLFILLEQGEAQVVIDFKEYRVQGIALGCILPGQVHHPITLTNNVSAWVMCLDGMFIRDEWKGIFETILIFGNTVVPEAGTVHELKLGFELLDRTMQSVNSLSSTHIVCALATAIAGIIAESYRQRQPVAFTKRLMSITLQFKTLLAVHLKTVKSPSQYANMLHISPTYLNEAVKKTTGFSAGYWIQSAAIFEAKRLLFYTDKSIKEIAFELGYDDHAYFTRLFTRLSGMPPTLFRANYRK